MDNYGDILKKLVPGQAHSLLKNWWKFEPSSSIRSRVIKPWKRLKQGEKRLETEQWEKEV